MVECAEDHAAQRGRVGGRGPGLGGTSRRSGIVRGMDRHARRLATTAGELRNHDRGWTGSRGDRRSQAGPRRQADQETRQNALRWGVSRVMRLSWTTLATGIYFVLAI